MRTLPQEVQTVLSTLKNSGFDAYVVGGSVRDLLMGKETKGWDFTTNATPEQILSLFPDSFYDNCFGTVGVKIYEDQEKTHIKDIFEITTFRSERGYTDNRHPDIIHWGTHIEDDLARRDFTINAIAYNGATFIDPYGGRKDIEKKVIRAVGNPIDRFSEDALRIMRAVRIATQLGFFIEEHTLEAIRSSVHLLQNISAERIRDELMKILASNYPADGTLLLKNTGILQIIIPELHDAFSVPQKSPKRHHIYDVGTHSVEALRHAPTTDPIVRLATLLHDIGKPKTFHKDKSGLITFYNHEVIGAKIAKDICHRLRLSKKQTDTVVTLVRWHQFSVDPNQTDSAIRRFIRRCGKENLEYMLALRIGDRLGGGAQETSWRLELFKKRLEDVQKQPFSIKDLQVNGHDVMRIFNIDPGPTVGKTLETLFSEVEQGILPNEREALLKRIQELALSTSLLVSSTTKT